MKKSYNRMIKVTLKTGEIEYDIIKKIIYRKYIR